MKGKRKATFILLFLVMTDVFSRLGCHVKGEYSDFLYKFNNC